MYSDVVVWFSSGAASAVASKIAVLKYGAKNVRVVNIPIKEEHEDNYRFALDVERWIGVPVEFLSNKKYPNNSCVDVWNDRKYMSGIKGAPCTKILKKETRENWTLINKPEQHILGFTFEEKTRHKRFVITEIPNVIPILIDNEITKKDCYEIIQKAGIELPEIYKMGYPNANCIGCVKATSPTYWNHVRQNHTLAFNKRAQQSREIGCRLVRYKGKRMFLDELPPDAKGRPMKNMNFECGIFCEITN